MGAIGAATRAAPRPNVPSRLALLALLAMLGTGMAVSAPLLERWWAGKDAERAADDVVAALDEGRALALGRSQVVHVVVDEALRAMSVEGGRWRKLPEGIALAGPPPGADGKGMIVFRPDGSSAGGQVVVSRCGRAFSVLVDRHSGRVRRVEAAG